MLFYHFISVFLLSQTGAQNSQPVQQYSYLYGSNIIDQIVALKKLFYNLNWFSYAKNSRGTTFFLLPASHTITVYVLPGPLEPLGVALAR